MVGKDNNTDARINRLHTDTAARNARETEGTNSFLQHYSGRQPLPQSSNNFYNNETTSLDSGLFLAAGHIAKSINNCYLKKLFPRFLKKINSYEAC